VLAGGDGNRLQALMAALVGQRCPSSSAPLFDKGETMLQRTMRRVALSVPP
jgi:hypothetical protein